MNFGLLHKVHYGNAWRTTSFCLLWESFGKLGGCDHPVASGPVAARFTSSVPYSQVCGSVMGTLLTDATILLSRACIAPFNVFGIAIAVLAK